MPSKFLQACLNGKVDVIKKCINLGHNVNLLNDCGQNGLFLACNNDQIEIVRLLIENKINLNKVDNDGIVH